MKDINEIIDVLVKMSETGIETVEIIEPINWDHSTSSLRLSLGIDPTSKTASSVQIGKQQMDSLYHL